MNGWRGSKRGNAAVVGLSLSAMLGFGALAVDIAVQRVANAQVQQAIEAAALGGSGRLDRTLAGILDARSQALALANLNGDQVLGGWSINADEVEVGTWDGTTFTVVDPDDLAVGDPLVLQVNAVRIQTAHTSIPAVLSSFVFGGNGLQSNNVALGFRRVSSGTATTVPCYLPMALPACLYADWIDGVQTEENPPPMEFIMANDNIDNMGWSNPFSSGFGSDDIMAGFLNNGCLDEPISLGDEMHVKNGQNMNVIDFLADTLNGDNPEVAPDSWDAEIAERPKRAGKKANCPPGWAFDELTGECIDPPGQPQIGSDVTDTSWMDTEPVIQGPVALVGTEGCDNTKFTGTMPVVGFAWAMVFDVQTNAGKGGNGKGVEINEQRNVWVQLDFLKEHDMGTDIDETMPGNITAFDDPRLVVF